MLSSLSQIAARRNGRAQNVDFSGVWFSELGARLTLAVDSGGRVSGRFRTMSGSPSVFEDFAVTGFASGDRIAFCVDFGRHGSVTGWVGQHVEGSLGPMIRASWLMGRDVEEPEKPESVLAAVLSGCNTFSR